jgi:hypothetical protein
MAYADETELEAGAMGQIVWTWPFTVGIPSLQEITDKLLPRPLLPLLPKWPGYILDKWNQFADLFHQRFSYLAGSVIADEETYLALIVESAEWAADELDFDLWDEEEGLPSLPPYNAPIGSS